MEDTPAEEPEEAPEEPAPVETPKTDSAPDITPEELRQARALLDKLLPAKEAEKEDDPKAGITLIRGGTPLRYTGDLSEDGKREGFGRTVNNNGITLYEGEYKNDLREGFGVHHYRSGAVSYIGDFKGDQREGFGVSFRESDHALHISHWQNGKPQGMATIFTTAKSSTAKSRAQVSPSIPKRTACSSKNMKTTKKRVKLPCSMQTAT